MAENQNILEGYSDAEKGAYLGTIASLATADRQATEEELEYITGLCQSASLSPQQSASVQQAAASLSEQELQRCLDVLKNSELKYSLVADLMSFAKADNDYSEEEEQNIQKISKYLGVNQQQFTALDQFSKQTTEQAEPTQQNFFGGGIKEKLEGAGINTGSLMKGILAIAAPMLMSRMLSRRGSGGFGGGGGLGGMLGGSGGGLGGMLGGSGGGLGSLIGMLSGGRGMSSTGGLLGRMLGGRGF
jgi:uncharacterized tellurite resistance protein B-like protein